MDNGALAGYKMDSMKVTLKDGSFHPVDSDQLSFEIAARNGYRAAAPKAGSVIKEPIMSVEVVTPEENMGDIIGDLNKRRGQVTGMESKGNARVVKAKVPPVGDVRLCDRAPYDLVGPCHLFDGVLALRGSSGKHCQGGDREGKW